MVIGSINMDLVCRTPHIPVPGETILGSDLVTVPGGKGANQAVAAAKVASPGTQIHLVGRIGNDDFGQRLLKGLDMHHVGTRHVIITEGVSTGCAMILVDKGGENSIVVAPGANQKLTPADIDAAAGLIRGAEVVMMQLEIPLATVRHALGMCRQLGVTTILDPAPVPSRGLPRGLYQVDLLVPNQTEAEALLARDKGLGRLKRTRLVDAKQIGSDLLSRGAGQVVLKLGRKGAMLVGHEQEIEHIKGFDVQVVDTTAAGDAFAGALAVARAEGMDWSHAVRFANAAGAVCCQAFGALPALPSREQVDKLLATPA